VPDQVHAAAWSAAQTGGGRGPLYCARATRPDGSQDEVKRLLLDIAFEVFCRVDDSESQVSRISQAFTDMMEGALGIVRFDTPGLWPRDLDFETVFHSIDGMSDTQGL
jgi:hypothetical protein